MRSKPVEIFFKIRGITYWRSSFYKPVLNTLLNVCCLIKCLLLKNLYFLPVSINERLHLFPAYRLIICLPSFGENLAPFTAEPIGDVFIHTPPELGLFIGWVFGYPAHQFHHFG